MMDIFTNLYNLFDGQLPGNVQVALTEYLQSALSVCIDPFALSFGRVLPISSIFAEAHPIMIFFQKIKPADLVSDPTPTDDELNTYNIRLDRYNLIRHAVYTYGTQKLENAIPIYEAAETETRSKAEGADHAKQIVAAYKTILNYLNRFKTI
jgi:hypothetical protein